MIEFLHCSKTITAMYSPGMGQMPRKFHFKKDHQGVLTRI